MTFIGPPPEAMRLLGDKIEAKYLAEQTGVPVAPWSGGPVEDIEDGRRHAEHDRLPDDPQGPQRRRRPRHPDGVRPEASSRRRSSAPSRGAKAHFNDPMIFMEQLVEGGRHIEVQVIADNHGNAWAPGVRDCSIQRRNQKLIEESSSPGADRRAGRRSLRESRSRWSRRPATAAPARWSSCTSRTRSCSPSSR